MSFFASRIFRPTLRGRILTGFAVIVLIMLLVTFYSVYNFYKFNESVKMSLETNYGSIISVGEMSRLLDEHQYTLVSLFNQKLESQVKVFDSLKLEFYRWYDVARSKPELPVASKRLFDTLNFKFTYFVTNVDESRAVLFTGKKTHQIDDSLLIYNGKKPDQNQLTLIIMNAVKEVKKVCNTIYKENQATIGETIEQNKEITRSAALWIVFILVAGSIIGFVFITKFTDYIIKPIKDLTQIVRSISEGNFDEIIPVLPSEDEISTLAVEFNAMSEKLQIYERMNVNKILFEKRKSEIILENINEPVVVTDEFLSVVIANKHFKEVFNIENTEGLNLKFLFPKNYFFDKYENMMGKKIKGKSEPFIILRDEEEKNKFFIPVYSFIHIPESDFAGMVIVFNDITKFHELDSMKSEFIAKVSHELKTPLTSLGMAVGLMEEGVVGELTPKQQDLLHSMNDDYKRLNKMVFEILELTKIEAGSLTLKFEKVDIRTLMEHITKDFAWRAEENGIKLSYSVARDVPLITGNPDYLLRALGNLIANSLKFTHRGGSITISIEKSISDIIITIVDTGIGIGQRQIDKIFDKFYQVDSNIQGSVGLGLSIVKEIVDLHHGEIRVKSQPGKGSEFVIRLPME